MEIFYNASHLWTSSYYKLYYARNILISSGIIGFQREELTCYMLSGTKVNLPPCFMPHFSLSFKHMLEWLQMMKLAAGQSD